MDLHLNRTNWCLSTSLYPARNNISLCILHGCRKLSRRLKQLRIVWWLTSQLFTKVRSDDCLLHQCASFWGHVYCEVLNLRYIRFCTLNSASQNVVPAVTTSVRLCHYVVFVAPSACYRFLCVLYLSFRNSALLRGILQNVDVRFSFPATGKRFRNTS